MVRGKVDRADHRRRQPILKVGGQPISVAVFGKYYVVRPDGAPAWGVRFVLTLLFPK